MWDNDGRHKKTSHNNARKKRLYNDTGGLYESSLGDETIENSHESGPSTMGIFPGNSDFDICSPYDGTSIDDNIIPPLHDPDWSKDDTDSSDDSNSRSFDEN